MCWCKWNRYLTAFYLMAFGNAFADGVVLGLGLETDDAGGRAVSAFADFAIAEDAWLSAAAATTRTGGVLDLNTTYLDAAIEHRFGQVGVRAGAAYWGDSEILDSVDLRASLLLSGARGALSLDYVRRDFDRVVESVFQPGRRRTGEFQSDGLGLTGRLNTSDRSSLFAGGMRYQYSRDLTLPQQSDALRLLSSSRLSLLNSLLDHRAYAGIEWRFNLTSIDLRVEHWQTTIDKGKVNSIGVGVLTPIADRSDIELRLNFDESENYGRTLSFAVYLYYFGGGV
jgi:hypothetical protein